MDIAPSLTLANREQQKIGRTHSSLSSLICEQLRERILQGEFRPGDRLIESKLSQEMAASKIPIREALRTLASEGLVTIKPRRGASVAILSKEMAYDMVEVRAALEGMNAKIAARRRNSVMVDNLQNILERGILAADEGDMATCRILNRKFHETLALGTENAFLTDLVNSLRDRTALAFISNSEEDTRRNWLDHEKILRAVVAGDSEQAEKLAAQHVYNAARAHLGTFPRESLIE